jgi:hypothetical protein
MIEVIAALIRWLALASCPIGIHGHNVLCVAYVTQKRALFTDEGPAAKHHTPVSEE